MTDSVTRHPDAVQRDAVNEAKRKLSPKHHRAFLAGKAPHLQYEPGKCPFREGDEVVLVAYVLSFTVTRIKLSRGKQVVSYALRDDRTAYLHSHATASTPDYVVTSAMAMQDESGPEEVGVPVDFQNVLQMNAKLKQAERSDTAEIQRERQARMFSSTVQEYSTMAAKLGIDPQPFLADLERQIKTKLHELRDAA